MHFVYLLYNSATDKFYIGMTENIKRRLMEHKSGSNQSTKYHCQYWRLIYSEIYANKDDAIAREKKLKYHGSGWVELKKRLAHTIKLNNKTGAGER